MLHRGDGAKWQLTLKQVPDLFVLAIGLAGNDPKTGLPVKPEVRLDYRELESLLAREGLS